MKKLILSTVIALSVSGASAQDVLYLQPLVGEGVSSSSFMPLHAYGASQQSYVLSQQYQLNVSIPRGRWQLETGIGYLTTGVSFISPYTVPGCGLLIPNPNSNNTTQGNSSNNTAAYKTTSTSNTTPEADKTKFTEINSHITLPVILNYTFYTAGKFSFSAGAGAELLFNMNNTITSSNEYAFANSGYQNPFHENSISGALILQAGATYNINKNFGVVLGPSAQGMFTSLVTKIDGEAMSRVYNYSYLMNAGIRIQLNTKGKHLPADKAIHS